MAHRRLDGESSAMLLDDPSGGRQAEAGAAPVPETRPDQSAEASATQKKRWWNVF